MVDPEVGRELAAEDEQEARAERLAIQTADAPVARAQGSGRAAPGGGAEPSTALDVRVRDVPVGGSSGGVGPLVGGLTAKLLRARERRLARGVYLAGRDAAKWEDKLLFNDKGGLTKSVGNLATILLCGDDWRGRLRFNAMTLYPHLDGEQIGESDLTEMRVQIERAHHLSVGQPMMAESVRLAAEADPYDPRIDWLNSLPAWDGTKRIDKVPEVFFGVKNALYSAYVKCFLLGAIRRVVEPGCLLHTVFVLVGAQGFKKSTFFRTLFAPWFSDTRIDVTSPREAAIQGAGAWVHEFGEVEEFTLYREDTRLKNWITSEKDTIRRPYAVTTEEVLRSFLCVGTTNEPNYLNDRTGTGSRRYHTVHVAKRIDDQLLAAWRDQLFAEALELHRTGAKHYLTEDEDVLRELAASAFYQDDPWDGLLARYVSEDTNHFEVKIDGGARVAIPSERLLVGALGLERGKAASHDARKLRVCMGRLGWIHSKQRFRRLGQMSKGAVESCYLAPVGWTVEALCPPDADEEAALAAEMNKFT